MTIEQINNLSVEECQEAFTKCCTASSWVNGMVNSRPFSSVEQLFETSDKIWGNINYQNWIEACEGHPKIGDVSSLAKKYSSTKQWAGNEQKGVDSASMEVIQKLAKGNSDYEAKFGYIFIVCATGKSASEMLEILENRIPNSPEKELEIAKIEQNKITHIRLNKLLSEN